MVKAEKIIKQAEAERDEKRQLLRPVAEFFHSHEGELFERYEAVGELVADERIPSSDERMLHRVVGNLAADRVDPVQNVVRDSAKYVGVLDYDEHDYWYEYVEVDDVHGRMNVGVCAQCVKEADSDAEVARGCGTTEELAERIEQHYSDEHSESPESVETGATLVSGTTISGNTAIHSANDGSGSGLDADQFRGTDGPGLVGANGHAAGEQVSKFSSPSSNPIGLGVASNNSIWNADDNGSIYEIDQSGTEQSKFSSPSSGQRGVGLDSNDCIWHADNTADSIYQLNQSGVVQSQFSSPSGSPQGLGVDSNDCLWNADNNSTSIHKLNQGGTEQSKFATPSSNPKGVGVDGNDCIWHGDSDADSIYKLNQSGTEQSKFTAPSGSPQGIGSDSSDSIWQADNAAVSIYQLYPQQKNLYSETKKNWDVQDSFTTPCGGEIGGIDFDDDGCLWFTDQGTDDDCIYLSDKNGNYSAQWPTRFETNQNKGVAIPSSQSIWMSRNDNNSLYEVDRSGSLITQMTTPSAGNYGIDNDSNDCLWIADANADCIYEINQSGAVQSKFQSPCTSVGYGLAVDNNGCIWFTDNNKMKRSNKAGNVNKVVDVSVGGVSIDENGSIWYTGVEFDSDDDTIYRAIAQQVKYE